MSIHVSVLVWQYSKLAGSDLTCLLALADQADDEGSVRPGLDTLQAKCRFKTRQGLLACLERLYASGEVVREHRKSNEGGSISNMYRIQVELLAGQPQLYHYSAKERREAAARAKAEAEGEGGVNPSRQGGVNPSRQGGVNPSRPPRVNPSRQGGVNPSRPESSFQSSVESSAEREGENPPPQGTDAAAAQGQGRPQNPTPRPPSPGTGPANGQRAGSVPRVEEGPGDTSTGTTDQEALSRAALEKCFPRSKNFLNTLLEEFPDRAYWLKIPADRIAALLSAQRYEFGDDYVTPLRRALDAEAREMIRAERGNQAAEIVRRTDDPNSRRAARRAARQTGE